MRCYPYGFPPCFRNRMKAIYTDLKIKIKVNGIEGEAKDVSNGVRQGCGASPLIFLLVQEALLSAIREDDQLEGIYIKSRSDEGEWTMEELRERCLADDTMVYLKDVEQLPRLFEIIKEYELASGQRLNPTKILDSPVWNSKGKEKRHRWNEMDRLRYRYT